MDQFIWPVTVLIIFLGMLWVVLRSLAIAHDLAKLVLSGGGKLPESPSIPVPAEVSAPAKSLLEKLVSSPAKPVPAPTPAPDSGAVVDQGLVDFIKKQEGFSAKAYWDYKQYTNGYGTKAQSSTEVIDKPEAERRLMVEIQAAEKLIEPVAANAPKGVKQALTDLTYNAGPGWEHQTLGELVKAGDYTGAKVHLLQYNHAGGKVLSGLTARREAEASWFDHPL